MDAVYHQSSFLGGEINPWAQGRSDSPMYKMGMTVCLNGVPVEEGAWTRRSGTMFISPTRGRNYAKLLPFIGSPTCSFVMEFTDNSLRFYTQTFLECTNDARTIASATLANPCIVTLDANSGWSDGDDIFLVFPAGTSQAIQAGMRNRALRCGSPSTDTFTLESDLGAGIDSSAFATGALVGAAVLRVNRFATSWAGADTLANLRAIQAETQSIILSGLAPYVVTITTEGTPTADAVFDLSAAEFVDGPYLDPVLAADGTSEPATVSAYTGSITFTDTSGLITFTSSDVGRHIRIFTQPPGWDAGTTYTYGEIVTGPDGAWWQSLAQGPYATMNVGITPGTNPPLTNGVVVSLWAPALNAGSWAWGKITAITSAHVVVVDLVTDLQSTNGTAVASWQLGLYTAGFYPTCGTYHEGRLWLAGAIPNRFDASMSNDIFTFSPTDPNGLVLDNSAIAETLNLPDLNNLFWMTPDAQGIVCGTLSGEVLISASSLNDPLTPTSIQAHRITTYGCANIEPRRVGMAIAFVQKHQRRLMEYLADAFSGRFTGKHLNEFAKHLSGSGIAEVAYQEETVPVIWNRMNDGSLAGCTYRRYSRFITEAPVFEAWHRHVHGRGATFESMCVIPGRDGLLDRLFVATNVDGWGRAVEVLQPFFEVDDPLQVSWYVDQSVGPGPGNSGYDCGGGNIVDPTTFPTTGGGGGTDSVPDTGGLPDGSGGDGLGPDGSGGGTFEGSWWLGVWDDPDQRYLGELSGPVSGSPAVGAWTIFDAFITSPDTGNTLPLPYTVYGTTTFDGSVITIPPAGKIRGMISIVILTGTDGDGNPISGTLDVGFVDSDGDIVFNNGPVVIDPVMHPEGTNINYVFDLDNSGGHDLQPAFLLTTDGHDPGLYNSLSLLPYGSGPSDSLRPATYIINYTPA